MKTTAYIALALLATFCAKEAEYDAQGTFEATEVTVSSEANGRILTFDVEEGSPVTAGEQVGAVDSLQLCLQLRQLRAQIAAQLGSRPDTQVQVASLRDQIAKQERERTRFANMLAEGAATRKQLDDIEAQISVLQSQLRAALSTYSKSTSTINDNVEAMEAQAEALDDRIAKCRIISPVSGTVLVKYAQAGEMTAVGKPLMKVADLNNIYLRAWLTSDQLAKVKLGQKVKVTADFGGDERYDYEGRVTWISPDSEFTPKNIQTNDTRANLVYAVKIAVKNDGRLKIGLAGEVSGL